METVIGLDIGGTKIAGGLVTYGRAGEPPIVEARKSVPTNAARGGDAVLEALVQLAEALVREAPHAPVGIGVGSAGIVDPESGAIRYANEIMPGWTGQPVQERLESAFGLPVAVLGEVQAHALGEARWGAARSASSSSCGWRRAASPPRRTSEAGASGSPRGNRSWSLNDRRSVASPSPWPKICVQS